MDREYRQAATCFGLRMPRHARGQASSVSMLFATGFKSRHARNHLNRLFIFPQVVSPTGVLEHVTVCVPPH
jgi:hypothetical protein